jgi:hypothetical protein
MMMPLLRSVTPREALSFSRRFWVAAAMIKATESQWMPAGDVYVNGRSLSDDFPATPGVLQNSRSNDCCNIFVAKLAGSGSALLYFDVPGRQCRGGRHPTDNMSVLTLAVLIRWFS